MNKRGKHDIEQIRCSINVLEIRLSDPFSFMQLFLFLSFPWFLSVYTQLRVTLPASSNPKDDQRRFCLQDLYWSILVWLNVHSALQHINCFKTFHGNKTKQNDNDNSNNNTRAKLLNCSIPRFLTIFYYRSPLKFVLQIKTYCKLHSRNINIAQAIILKKQKKVET